MTLPSTLLTNPEAAAIELARYLNEGSLVLLVGAGASKNVGLPMWWELVKRCLIRAGLTGEAQKIRRRTSNEELRAAMDRVQRQVGNEDKYKLLVKESLYEGVEFSDAIITERLLIAFGALLMGSKRGRIRNVVSFNFGDVLEWYLRLHGFQVQVISKIPCLVRDVDVVTYHPHGFLPKAMPHDHISDILVLSQYSYDERLGETRNLWKELTAQLLREKVGLFVGLSGKDPTFGPMLVDVKNSIGSSRPTGFWLFGPDDVEMEDFKQRNIVPVRFNDFKDIPNFLLKVCQVAVRA